MEIERYIPEGREHAISRKELRALLGRDDRVIREWIKQANRRLEPEGKVILSSSSWRGYWISSDPEEIAAYLQEQGSRARTQAKNDEPARRLLARLRGGEDHPGEELYPPGQGRVHARRSGKMGGLT